jgi:hypothetical protein
VRVGTTSTTASTLPENADEGEWRSKTKNRRQLTWANTRAFAWQYIRERMYVGRFGKGQTGEVCAIIYLFSCSVRISASSLFFSYSFCISYSLFLPLPCTFAFLTDHSLSRAETSQIVISTPNLQLLAPTPTPTQKTDTGRTPLPGAQAGRALRKPWQPRCGSRGFSRGRVRSFLFVFIPIAYIFLTSRYFRAARRSFFFLHSRLRFSWGLICFARVCVVPSSRLECRADVLTRYSTRSIVSLTFSYFFSPSSFLLLFPFTFTLI